MGFYIKIYGWNTYQCDRGVVSAAAIIPVPTVIETTPASSPAEDTTKTTMTTTTRISRTARAIDDTAAMATATHVPIHDTMILTTITN